MSSLSVSCFCLCNKIARALDRGEFIGEQDLYVIGIVYYLWKLMVGWTAKRWQPVTGRGDWIYLFQVNYVSVWWFSQEDNNNNNNNRNNPLAEEEMRQWEEWKESEQDDYETK